MDSIVLEANGSGRMWADDLDVWVRLLTSDGCPVCQDAERVGTVAESDHVWVNIWPEAVLPGYVCIFSKQHVIEPFDLSEADQAHFFLDCMAVARGVASVIEPAKMNYEIHGNTVPHLHMHLFPRTPDDVSDVRRVPESLPDEVPAQHGGHRASISSDKECSRRSPGGLRPVTLTGPRPR